MDIYVGPLLFPWTHSVPHTFSILESPLLQMLHYVLASA